MSRKVVLYALLASLAVSMHGAYAVEAGTQHGSIRVDPSVYFLDMRNVVVVQIEGATTDQRRQDVTITVTGPDSRTSVMTAKATADGKFVSHMSLPPSSLTGTYYVSGALQGGERLGQLSFRVLEAGIGSGVQPQPSQQQQPQPGLAPLTVATDRGAYGAGDTVSVAGEALPGGSVGIRVSAPNGNVIFVDQAVAGADGTYSATVRAGGSLWAEDGTYTIKVADSYGQTSRADFLFGTASAQQPGAAAPPVSAPAPAAPQQPAPTPAADAPAPAAPQQPAPTPAAPPQMPPEQQVSRAFGAMSDLMFQLVGTFVTLAIIMAIAIVGFKIYRSRRRYGPQTQSGLGAQAAGWSAKQGKSALGQIRKAGSGISVPGAITSRTPVASTPKTGLYECPKCHDPDIQNNPDGSFHCPSCKFSGRL